MVNLDVKRSPNLDDSEREKRKTQVSGSKETRVQYIEEEREEIFKSAFRFREEITKILEPYLDARREKNQEAIKHILSQLEKLRDKALDEFLEQYDESRHRFLLPIKRKVKRGDQVKDITYQANGSFMIWSVAQEIKTHIEFIEKREGIAPDVSIEELNRQFEKTEERLEKVERELSRIFDALYEIGIKNPFQENTKEEIESRLSKDPDLKLWEEEDFYLSENEKRWSLGARAKLISGRMTEKLHRFLGLKEELLVEQADIDHAIEMIILQK